MTGLRLSLPTGLGIAVVATIAIAVPVVVARHGSAATIKVAPLSATDRQVLVASKPLIAALPTALSQVPTAASDASHGRVTPTQAVTTLAQTPALAALSRAVKDPTSVTGSLTSAYDDVLAGRTPSSGDLEQALETLQTVEGQIPPAIRVMAATGGTPPSSAAALTALQRDPKNAQLLRLLSGWQQVYGAFTLVEQQQEAAG